MRTGLLVALLALCSCTALAQEKRMRVIDFEDEVVEGVNKSPLDSLRYLSDAEKDRKRAHLYRKRAGFKTEVQETVREMRYR